RDPDEAAGERAHRLEDDLLLADELVDREAQLRAARADDDDVDEAARADLEGSRGVAERDVEDLDRDDPVSEHDHRPAPDPGDRGAVDAERLDDAGEGQRTDAAGRSHEHRADDRERERERQRDPGPDADGRADVDPAPEPLDVGPDDVHPDAPARDVGDPGG